MKDGPVEVTYQRNVIESDLSHYGIKPEKLIVSATISIAVRPVTRQYKELLLLMSRWRDRIAAADTPKRSKKKRRHA